MDIVNEEPYLSSQIIEIMDKLFIGNFIIQPVIAGRIAEILKILIQKEDTSDNKTSMEDSRKHKLPAIQNLDIIFSSFHKVVRQLRIRHYGRNPFEIKDEYDVQDLLCALLHLYFDDIRAEEWTPSYAGRFRR